MFIRKIYDGEAGNLLALKDRVNQVIDDLVNGAVDTVLVDGVNGDDDNDGSVGAPFATIRGAVSAIEPSANKRTLIAVMPGEYDEAITIPRTKPNTYIVGLGGRGAAFVAPSAANAIPLTCEADDCGIVNLGLETNGTGTGLQFSGKRFRGVSSKIEGGTNAMVLAMGTVAQIAAGTKGDGADCLFEDCEFCWTDNGVVLDNSDYGAVTQARFRNCIFHNCATVCIKDNGADPSVRDVEISGCRFMNDESGVAPTDYVVLNTANNTGFMSGNFFATATNASAVITIAAGIMYSANATEAGWSTARPV